MPVKSTGGESLKDKVNRKAFLLQTLFFLIGLAAFVWFAIPLYVRIFNIGNQLGIGFFHSVDDGRALFGPIKRRLIKWWKRPARGF